MGKKKKIKITRFRNPSGNLVFKVSGSLDGKQIRRNFKSRPEAVAERDKLEIELLNGTTRGRHMWVKITPEQYDDAWTALSLLKNADRKNSLTQSVEFFLQHHIEPEKDILLSDAVDRYVAVRIEDFDSGAISVRQLKSIRSELKRLSHDFGERQVSEIQSIELENFVSKGKVSLKTRNNRRGYLQTFFIHCREKGYVAINPVEKIKRYKVKHLRGSATTVTAKQAAELMEFLETYQGRKFKNGKYAGEPGCLVPFFALCLFAGIRPDWKNGEISKIRPKDIKMSTNTIHVEPEVSKTNEKRSLTIQPNLKAWLKRYPLKDFPIIPFPNVERSLIKLRKQFKLPHDVLRHTYISMLVGKSRSVGDAALQAGNSEDIVRKHYLNLKSETEASKFWKISPRKPLHPKL